MGYELLAWAQQRPRWRLLGVELYQPGIGSMLSRLKTLGIANVRLVDQPAQLLLQQLTDESLSEVRIFFPDPWPKKRHHKRRLIQPDFLEQLHQKLLTGGTVRLATDWAAYAEWMVEHFAKHPGFELVQDEIRAANEPSVVAEEVREITKFEARGERLGHEIRDLLSAPALSPVPACFIKIAQERCPDSAGPAAWARIDQMPPNPELPVHAKPSVCFPKECMFVPRKWIAQRRRSAAAYSS